MLPAFYTSNLAARLCRQFRRPPRNLRILPAYTRCFDSFPRQSLEGKEKGSSEIGLEPLSELIILRTPRPPKLRHEGLLLVEEPVEDGETIQETQDKLLKWEAIDAQIIDIALMHPAAVEVSQERYQQLAQQLRKSFLKAQLFEYYRTQDSEGRTPQKLHYTATKSEIIDAILSVKWGVAVSKDIPEKLDVLVNRDFQGTRRDIFFILGKGLFFFFPFHIARSSEMGRFTDWMGWQTAELCAGCRRISRPELRLILNLARLVFMPV